jgi:predicted phage tail protein
MLRTIRIYGRLAKFLGRRKFEAEVSSAAEAVRFLLTNFPQLERHMADQHYRVSVGGYDLALSELNDPAGQQEIKIVPVVAGAGAVGRIIAGVALLAVGLLVPGIGALGVQLLVGVGASLVLGGVAQLLTPVPTLNGASTTDTNKDPRKSYSFQRHPADEPSWSAGSDRLRRDTGRLGRDFSRNRHGADMSRIVGAGGGGGGASWATRWSAPLAGCAG